MKKNMDKIDERFHRNLFLFLENEIPSDSKFVLAVSGGIDSMVLLRLFAGYFRRNEGKLCVAHLNHGIREESDEEYGFVCGMAEKSELPFFGSKFDIPKMLKTTHKGQSLEECAREVRRDFLNSVREQFDGNYIVMAHHRDDLLETFIMRLLKGSGINGITGMRKKDGNILRPLLGFWRTEIEEYARLYNVQYRDDKTNYDTAYLRNRIRIDTIPHLCEKYGRSVKEILINDLSNFSSADGFIDYYYLTEFKKKCEINTDECHVFFEDVRKYPDEVRREYLLRLFQDWKGNVFGLDRKKILAICERLREPGNFSMDIDKSSIFVKSYDDLYFRRREYLNPVCINEPEMLYDSEKALENNPVLIFGEADRYGFYGITSDVIEKMPEIPDESGLTAYLDLDCLDFPVYIRNAMEGDRFIPLGMTGNKKISKFLKDSHVPREMRRRVMVLLNSKHDIIWCIGLRIADCFKVGENTKRILRLKIEKSYDNRKEGAGFTA